MAPSTSSTVMPRSEAGRSCGAETVRRATLVSADSQHKSWAWKHNAGENLGHPLKNARDFIMGFRICRFESWFVRKRTIGRVCMYFSVFLVLSLPRFQHFYYSDSSQILSSSFSGISNNMSSHFTAQLQDQDFSKASRHPYPSPFPPFPYPSLPSPSYQYKSSVYDASQVNS